MSGFEVDLGQFVANAVPGAVGSDLLAPGDQKALIISAVLTGVTMNFVWASRSRHDKAVMDLYRKAPFLGLGVGYAGGRVVNLTRQQALLTGVIGALLAYEYMRKRDRGIIPPPSPGLAGNSEVTTNQQRVYQAVHTSPQAAPAGQIPWVPYF